VGVFSVDDLGRRDILIEIRLLHRHTEVSLVLSGGRVQVARERVATLHEEVWSMRGYWLLQDFFRMKHSWQDVSAHSLKGRPILGTLVGRLHCYLSANVGDPHAFVGGLRA